jgi:surface carbohydrate biosynthesis protein
LGKAWDEAEMMRNPGPQLLIPVENQVREFDAKLLLACIGAKRGFSSVIGSRREMEFRIASFPRSIYLSKSMTIRSALLFKAAHKVGHHIVAWDEEALVHLPPETYFSDRLSPASIRYVSHLLAWGQNNADLWRGYSHLPNSVPIHITGNPRADMLRPEMRPFFAADVEKIQKSYENFILLNTNFNHVNAFSPEMNLFKPVKKPEETPSFGRGARGMSREFAEGLRDHKKAVFESFQQLIPALEGAFPDYTIIVRPHPTENQQIYRNIAARCKRVQVTNEGNVVPWILASKAVIHNCCTTGLEAYVMGVPAISYRATVNDYYDLGFYRLPNLLSHQCFHFEELQATLKDILAGKLGPADGAERQELINHHMVGLDGPLACERIVDTCDQILNDGAELGKPGLLHRLNRWYLAKGLGLINRYKSYLPGEFNKPAFQRHRYPGIPIGDLCARLLRFQTILGHSEELKVEEIFDQIFRISG